MRVIPNAVPCNVRSLIRPFIALVVIAIAVPSMAQEPLFEYIDHKSSGVTFENAVLETSGRNIGTYDYMYNGSGVAIADFNNDNLPDLFFAGNDVPNKLYLNKGNFEFKEVWSKPELRVRASGPRAFRWLT